MQSRLAYALRLPLAALLTLPACIIIEESPSGDDPPADTSAVIVTESCPGFPAYVETAEVVGDRLVVTASYGGCGATALWACWDGAFRESFPVQAPLTIHHADAGDCDALITDAASISLAPVIDAYADAYGGLDTIIVPVGDFAPRWEP